MRSSTTIGIVFLSATMALAGGKFDRQKVSVADMTRAVDPSVEISQVVQKTPAPQAYAGIRGYGPGVFLMDSGYDYPGNGAMQRNLINYGDGTFGMARMATSLETNADRGSWFSYFDGTSWSPIQKVEAVSRGWTETAVMSDGRQVTVAHTGNEVNVDALKGFGIWTSSVTGYIAGATDHIWPHMTVDGADNIHFISTLRAVIAGARYGTYYPVHTWSTDEGATWNHKYIYGDPFTELDTSNGQWQGFSIDNYPIDAYGPSNLATMAAPRNAPGIVDAVWLAESNDNGATWNTRKVATWNRLPAAGVDEYRPSHGVALAYDNNGNVHIVTANYLVRLDSAGTAADVFHSTAAPMRHWSEATGWVDMLTYQNIPGYDPNEDIFSGDAVNSAGAGNNTTLKSPCIGFDANNNMYVTFNTPAPGDTTLDGINLMDVYVVGSADGGATWGPPIQITTERGLEDGDASLAKLVDDYLHIVYNSDPQFGNNTASGAPPYRTNMMYYAFPKANVPLQPSAVAGRPNAQTPTGFALRDNYPNPFNPSTNLTFDLPRAAQIRLAIYDVAGQQVAELVNGKYAAGSHSVTWTAAARMSSGVYFAKLEAEGFVGVKKMMLVK